MNWIHSFSILWILFFFLLTEFVHLLLCEAFKQHVRVKKLIWTFGACFCTCDKFDVYSSPNFIAFCTFHRPFSHKSHFSQFLKLFFSIDISYLLTEYVFLFLRNNLIIIFLIVKKFIKSVPHSELLIFFYIVWVCIVW